MTREEYLNQVENLLNSLTNDEKKEAISYYSDYFEEANDDEKIIEELGSPEKLAKVITEKFANTPVKTETVKEESENSEKDFYSENVLFYSFEKNDVKHLYLEFGMSEVVLIPGNKYCVETRGIIAQNLVCHLSNDGILEVRNSKRVSFNFFGHDRQNSFVPKILITIPEDANIERLKINMGAGNLRTHNISLNCQKGSINVGAGNLVLGSVKGGKINMRCGMGNLSFTGKLTEKSDIDCGMGNITLDLLGNPDEYSYDLKLALGEFKLNGEKRSGICQVQNSQRKQNHISVNCGMGNVKINIK